MSEVINLVNNTNLLLYICLTPGLGRVHFFDYFFIEEVVRLKWLCKATSIMGKYLEDLQSVAIGKKTRISKFNGFSFLKKVEHVLFYKVKNVNMTRQMFPISMRQLSVIECSNVQLDVNLCPVESLTLRNNSLTNVIYKPSIVKRLECIGYHLQNKNQSNELLACHSALQELKIAIRTNERTVIRLSADAMTNLKKLWFSSNIMSNLLLVPCNGCSHLEELHVKCIFTLQLSSLVFDSVRMLHLQFVHGISKIKEHEQEEQKENKTLSCVFSNLQDLKIMNISWLKMQSLLTFTRFVTQNVHIITHGSTFPIELDMNKYFPSTEGLTFQCKSNALETSFCPFKIVGTPTLRKVKVYVETKMDSLVVLSQMSGIKQLSCVHNSCNNASNVAATTHTLFTVLLKELNPNLQPKDTIIMTKSDKTLLNIKCDATILTNHFKTIIQEDSNSKTQVVMEILTTAYSTVQNCIQPLQSKFDTFITKYFSSQDKLSALKNPSTALWFQEQSERVFQLYDYNYSILKKHLSSLCTSQKILWEKFETLKRQFYHSWKGTGFPNTNLTENIVSLSDEIEPIFQTLPPELPLSNTSSDVFKKEITKLLSALCLEIYYSQENVSLFLNRVNTKYLATIQQHIDKVKDGGVNVNDLKHINKAMRWFQQYESKKCENISSQMGQAFAFMNQIGHLQRTNLSQFTFQLGAFHQLLLHLKTLILQLEGMVQEFDNIIEVNSNHSINDIPTFPILS